MASTIRAKSSCHGRIRKAFYKSSLYNGKTYGTIDVPGATASFAQDLNSAGDVIYQWFDSNGASHGALLQAGKYYKF